MVWVYNIWNIINNTMEYYSAIKNEIMPFAVFWANTDIIFCYVKYKRNKYCMMSLICEIYYMIQMNFSTKER